MPLTQMSILRSDSRHQGPLPRHGKPKFSLGVGLSLGVPRSGGGRRCGAGGWLRVEVDVRNEHLVHDRADDRELIVLVTPTNRAELLDVVSPTLGAPAPALVGRLLGRGALVQPAVRCHVLSEVLKSFGRSHILGYSK